MAWVKSEYAGELSVLSTWLVAVAPWAVSTFGDSTLRVVVLRFLPFRFQFIFGARIADEVPILPAWAVAGFQEAPALQFAGHLGFAALLVFLPLFGLSVGYYADEERVESASPVDPVRIFGAGLALVGVSSLASTALFVLYFPGISVPVGSLVALVLGGVLLTVDRTE